MPKHLIKPHVFDCREGVVYVGPGNKYESIEKHIKQNQKVCFTRTYGTALSFYSWLKRKIRKDHPENDYQSGRKFREELRELASKILVKVIDGKIDLKGVPDSPWLKEFFPKRSCYYISFPDLLGVNGAWQWYSKGIQFPGLSFKIHPYYGTYFPTRFEHLELFDTWLSNSNKKFNNAIDIGTGCGVLTFYMLKLGIENICATDINPNALYSFKKDLEKQGLSDKVLLQEGSFFSGLKDKFELIVFNPPWIPGKPNTIIDKGIYYKESMWDSFFAEVINHITIGGRLVVLFSDFALVEGVCSIHPLKHKLESDDRFSVNSLLTKSRGDRKYGKSRFKLEVAGNKSRETIELWEIEFKGSKGNA